MSATFQIAGTISGILGLLWLLWDKYALGAGILLGVGLLCLIVSFAG